MNQAILDHINSNLEDYEVQKVGHDFHLVLLADDGVLIKDNNWLTFYQKLVIEVGLIAMREVDPDIEPSENWTHPPVPEVDTSMFGKEVYFNGCEHRISLVTSVYIYQIDNNIAFSALTWPDFFHKMCDELGSFTMRHIYGLIPMS